MSLQRGRAFADDAETLIDRSIFSDPVLHRQELARVFARTTFLSDSREDLKRVRVPTLVLDCTQDVIAPREVGAYVHRSIPDSTLVTLDATGHCPHLSAPDATNEAITAFLAGLR